MRFGGISYTIKPDHSQGMMPGASSEILLSYSVLKRLSSTVGLIS